jgi:hypothetical protein
MNPSFRRIAAAAIVASYAETSDIFNMGQAFGGLETWNCTPRLGACNSELTIG